MTQLRTTGRNAAIALVAALVTLSQALMLLPGAAEAGTVFNPRTNRWETTPGETRLPAPAHGNSVRIERRVVDYPSAHRSGTIIIDTQARQLYRIINRKQAMEFAIGVGREGFQWKGVERVSRKTEWPTWTPPQEMRKREAAAGRELPIRMEGGPDNPLGARAIYLGSTLFRIHGTNQPWTIGHPVSSGCIRLTNEDVIFLYDQVRIGDKVIVK